MRAYATPRIQTARNIQAGKTARQRLLGVRTIPDAIIDDRGPLSTDAENLQQLATACGLALLVEDASAVVDNRVPGEFQERNHMAAVRIASRN